MAYGQDRRFPPLQPAEAVIVPENPAHSRETVPGRTGKPKLLDQLSEALRARHYSRRTEQTYRQWARRFIFFHNVRHPSEMAEP